MRPRARSLVGRPVRRLLNSVGLDLVAYPEKLLFGARRRALRELGITVVLDVGANIGQYALLLRRDGYRGRIVSFEPLPDAFSELARRVAADSAWECRRLALSDRDGTAEFHRAGNSMSSSLLHMRAEHADAAPESRYVGAEPVRVARLDSLAVTPPDEVALLQPGDRVFLKLDVQGAEGQVLNGSRETLQEVQAIECELSLVRLYEGQPLLSELIEQVDHLGFGLIALEPGFSDPRSGRLLQLEGLFTRA